MNTMILLITGYVTIDEHNDIIDYRLRDLMNTIILLITGYVTIDEHNDIIDYRLRDYR